MSVKYKFAKKFILQVMEEKKKYQTFTDLHFHLSGKFHRTKIPVKELYGLRENKKWFNF